MRSLSFLALAALVAVVAIRATTTAAQLPPARFYGTALLNGDAPTLDTAVDAYVGDLLCSEGGRVQELGDPPVVG